MQTAFDLKRPGLRLRQSQNKQTNYTVSATEQRQYAWQQRSAVITKRHSTNESIEFLVEYVSKLKIASDLIASDFPTPLRVRKHIANV